MWLMKNIGSYMIIDLKNILNGGTITMRKKFIVLLMIIFLLFLSSCNSEGKQYRKLKNLVIEYGELIRTTENVRNYKLDLDGSTDIVYSDFSNPPDCVGISYRNNNQSIKNSDGEYVPFSIQILLNQKGFEDEYETEIQLFGIHHEKLMYKNAFYEYCNKVSENTDKMAEILRKQLSGVEEGADKLFAKLVVMEEDTDRKTEE